MFTPWQFFSVEGCGIVRGITVGRSSQTMRLFVTCSNGGSTVVKLVDRNVIKHSVTGLPQDDEYEFKTLPYVLHIETDSQPFIGDLNGDFLDDIMYTEASSSNQIMVAF